MIEPDAPAGVIDAAPGAVVEVVVDFLSDPQAVAPTRRATASESAHIGLRRNMGPLEGTAGREARRRRLIVAGAHQKPDDSLQKRGAERCSPLIYRSWQASVTTAGRRDDPSHASTTEPAASPARSESTGSIGARKRVLP